MKIGIEAQRLFREKKHGLEIVALELIRNLQQLDKVNEYVIFVRNDKDNTCIQETSNFKIREIPARSFPEWEQIKLPKAVREEKIDLLHCTANTGPIFSSTPMILTLHDIIFMEKLQFSRNYYQAVGNLYRKLILPSVIKKSKKVLTVSNSEKIQIVNHLKIDPDQVDVIYNATDSSFRKMEHTEVGQLRIKYALPEKFILFFGNTAQKKNSIGTIKGYIAYARSHKEALPLIVAGAFEDYIRRELSKLDIPNDIRAKIIIIGYIPFHEQPAIYNLAHLFLYTSMRESFGMPILESMACGTPVITSTTSSMPEIAGDAAVLVDPANEISIAEGIAKAMTNEIYYNELVQSGFRRAAQFNWKTSTQQLLHVYHEILPH
jgi:glycosyltransferase involved in cell wall biosynthesis